MLGKRNVWLMKSAGTRLIAAMRIGGTMGMAFMGRELCGLAGQRVGVGGGDACSKQWIGWIRWVRWMDSDG